MKKLVSYMLLLLLGCGIFSPLTAAPRHEAQKDETIKQEIIKKVQARRFRIRITEAAGRHGSSGLLDGSVAIYDSLLISNLPYYGKMRGTVTDPSQLSLNFESPTIDYVSSIIYDGTSKILFNAERGNENFIFYIEISPKGSAKVTIRSNQRTPASYSGEIEY